MKKTLILLSLFAGDSLAMFKYVGRKSEQKFPLSTIGSASIGKYFSSAPQQFQVFQDWVIQQSPKVKQAVNKYKLINRYNYLLKQQATGDSQVSHEIQMINIMMQSIMKDPEQAEEILQFYHQLNQANTQVHQALDRMPVEFQQLLDKRVQEYALYVQGGQQVEETVLTPMQRFKMFIVRMYPYLVCCILFSMQVLLVIEAFFQELKRKDPASYKELKKQLSLYNIPERDRPHVVSVQDQNLLELLDVLIDAFSLENIAVYQSSQPYSDSGPALAGFFPSAESIIILFPNFFEQSAQAQLFTLLHEIRHLMQYNEGLRFVVPQDLFDLAVSLGVKKHTNSLSELLLLSRFYSGPMREFDADTFATLQLKSTGIPHRLDSRLISHRFDPSSGYLSGELVTQLVGPAKQKSVVEKVSQRFSDYVAMLRGENVYVRLLPDHIKQQAKENRAKKQVLQQLSQVPAGNLFHQEW